jgi:23S rRNA-/tRNA-specific pseudouridylate synthase
VWNGVDYLKKGWFTFDNPVQDESGKFIDSSTDFRFIASKTMPLKEGDADEGRKIAIVLARPKSGRYHQIRQHLSSGTIGHSILGDSSHGRSRTNRLWKKNYNLLKERVCLHLIRLQIPATDYTDDIDVSSPLPSDLRKVLSNFPDLMEQARPILAKEGISI